MSGVKFFVGLMPHRIRLRLRENLWLRNLYSSSLLKSGLFYGFPSAQKLQKLYVANMAHQQEKISCINDEGKQPLTINCLVILSGQQDLDAQSVAQLVPIIGEGRLFLLDSNNGIRRHNENSIEADSKNSCSSEQCAELLVNVPLLVLRSGDQLHADALSVFSKADYMASDEFVTYCDIDNLDPFGTRQKAEFFPDWDPDLQLSTGYIKTGIMINGVALINHFLNFSKQYRHASVIALWVSELYLARRETTIQHIPYCLIHQAVAPICNWPKELLTLNRDEIKIESGDFTEVASVAWKPISQPLVSLIIPTKNAKTLVQNCINSITAKTTYQYYEILLVDNNSDDPEAIEYFDSLALKHTNIQVLKYPYGFNYSAINNFAVKHAKGDIIGLVNNDIEVISPNWLTDMVGHVQRDDIGCVGAKLLYPDNRVQHAGVVMGYGGGAGHAHKYFPRDHAGYLYRLAATNSFSAVTAACLLVKKADYESVGGLNETDLTIAFNDVDFCLKILELGRRNLYCAEAELYHHESVSRGHEDTKEKQQRFQSELNYLQTKWVSHIAHDSCYNPNLTLRRENFSIKGGV
jgi:GT2 family glycosyltransferase